jgi:hypothetical protein
MQAPEWNRQDKAGSLELWIEMLNGEARRQFLEAGTHVEIFFIFGNEGLMEVVPVAGMNKDDVVRKLKIMLAEREGYAFIHISEGTMRHMDTAGKADMLLVHAESRDGLGVVYCSAVALSGAEKMLLDAVKVEGRKLEGRFTHIFQDL